MDVIEAGQVTFAILAMVGALILSFIPIMPGPVLLWGVAVIFAVAEGFTRMTPFAVVVATVITIAGSTTDLWLPLFGVQTGGMSCLSSIGGFIGGMVGTFAIPIPIVGTILGCVGGSLVVELIHLRKAREALKAGKTALKLYILSYVLELASGIGVFIVFLISLYTTQPA